MLHHVSIGARDIPGAKKFYDAALKPLGYRCVSDSAESLGYGSGDSAGLWVNKSSHPVAADKRSQLHFCFVAPTRKSVDAFHAAAVASGGQDNGAPGLRVDYGDNYYAAFVVDPEGYRLEAYCSRAE